MIIWIFQGIGHAIRTFIQEIGQWSILAWNIFKSTGYLLKHPHLVIQQMMEIGVRSLPLVSVVSLFTGAVSSWQAAYQFKGVISTSLSMDFLGAAVSAAILIELSPVLTGIVVAGRVGASIAAEIGTMKVTEQIDALETLAIDPIYYLASPRFMAGFIMLPILVIHADFLAHLGAYSVAFLLLNISTETFFGSAQRHFLIYNVFSGLIKAVVFGAGTALIGCSIGFRTSGGAEGVGKSTIKAFVFASAFILIFDYILAMILF
ncbi:MAG: ABC transporter permease [Bacteroidetes bacterium RBG_13_42_15]|nr:MAG: ABC transporter permease [Bacteroidetes bacterium RBG_13_42_15]HJX70295.1 ABC transporter permease [Bacteroidales bacterium]